MGELRVVLEADALVTEVAANLIDTLIPSDQQALQVQLERNTQIKLLLELVVMGRERPRRRTAIERLQDGSLDLKEVVVVHKAAQGAKQACPFAKDVAHFGIDRQISVALAIAFFHIGEGAVADDLPIHFLLLGNRQRADGLTQDAPFAHVKADLAQFGAEHLAAGLHKVAQVEQLFEGSVGFLAHVVAAHEELQAAVFVGNVGEDGLAHVTDADQPAADRDRHGRALFGGLKSGNGFGRRMRSLDPQRIGIDTLVLQTGQLFQTLFLKRIRFPTHRLAPKKQPVGASMAQHGHS